MFYMNCLSWIVVFFLLALCKKLSISHPLEGVIPNEDRGISPISVKYDTIHN